MKMRRIDVPISLDDLSEAINHDGLEGVVLWAERIAHSVPKEFRDGIHISLERDRDAGWEFEFFYNRPETPLDRQNDEREAKEIEAKHHAADYSLYQRLKLKYEGK